MQGRALMFEVYLPEYGACFDKFALSHFVWKERYKKEDQLSLGQYVYGMVLVMIFKYGLKRLLKNCDVQIC